MQRDEVIAWLSRIRELEQRIEDARGELDDLALEGKARFGNESLVIETPDGYIWVPNQFELQCVARTRKGDRCRNRVFDGQVWRYDLGPIARLDSDWLGRLLSQTCQQHDEVQATSYAPTEWVFGRHNEV